DDNNKFNEDSIIDCDTIIYNMCNNKNIKDYGVYEHELLYSLIYYMWVNMDINTEPSMFGLDTTFISQIGISIRSTFLETNEYYNMLAWSKFITFFKNFNNNNNSYLYLEELLLFNSKLRNQFKQLFIEKCMICGISPNKS